MDIREITGFAYTKECGSIKIQEIAALDFHLKFIDTFAGLLLESQNPKITVSLFQQKDVPALGVLIIPQSISDISNNMDSKTFNFQLKLTTAETSSRKAYAQILNLIKICVSVIEATRNKLQGLTIASRMSIVNSNEVILNLTINKMV